MFLTFTDVLEGRSMVKGRTLAENKAIIATYMVAVSCQTVNDAGCIDPSPLSARERLGFISSIIGGYRS